MSDPTHGRIDPDIQRQVDELKPTSLGQRVAMENTLQERRNARRLPFDGQAMCTCRAMPVEHRINDACMNLMDE